jgi:PAS domain S-box-containing protein
VRPPRLVLRFAIYSAFALVFAWLAIFWVVRETEEGNARQGAETLGLQLASRAAPSLRASDLAAPVGPGRRQELDELFRHELAGDLVRITLWSPGGIVTYSTDPSLIGSRAVQEEERQELTGALAGRSRQDRSRLNEEGGSGADVEVLETWVPLNLSRRARADGAFEIIRDYGPVATEIRATVTPVAIALGLTLALLYAALLPILRQVTRTLENRHKRLAEHASELAEALEERRRVEQRLSQAERNYRNLVEQLPLAMYMDRLNETSSTIYTSPQIESMLGYPVLDWMSDPDFFPKVLHPDDRERVLEEHRRHYAEGRSFTIEYRVIARDGRVVWILDEVTVARDEHGRPTHAQGFMLDVTERREAKLELERSHAELTALHDTALLLIDQLDAEKLLGLVAERAGELVGTTHAYVYLQDGDEEISVRLGTGAFAGNVGNRLRKGEGLGGRVWESGEPLAVENYQTWEGRHASYEGAPFHAVVGVPLRTRREVVGVLGLAHVEEGLVFGQAEIELLMRFAHLVALALESARLYTEVRTSEERFRTVVSNVPGAIFRCAVDDDWTVEFISDAIEEISGFPASDFVDNRVRSLASIIHPDDANRLQVEVEEALNENRSYSLEYRIVRRDGDVRWVLERGHRAARPGDTPYLDGAIFDNTDRRAAEDMRARLAAVVESSDDAIMSASLDLHFTSWNSGAERLFGYTAEEVLGKPVALLMPPDRQEEAFALVREVIDEAKVAHLETVRLHDDGTPVDISFTYSPIRDRSGGVVGVSAIGQDITERKRAEVAIRESEAKFRSFVETTEEWVWAIDEHGVTTYSNPAIERILGYTPAQVVGVDALDFMLEEDRTLVESELPGLVERKEGWSGLVVRWRHRDGSVRHLESTATPILDGDGRIVGWRGTDRDVTHRIRAEAERERLLAAEQEARAAAEAAQHDLAAQNERLRELDRLKDEFIALVSHELRTPLTSIRGYTELLLDGEAGELADDQRQFLGVIERNSHRLLHLVGDLLFLAQVEAGKLVLDVGAVDLGAVASESVETARPQAEAKGITLTLATGPVPLVAGDRARIAQLIDNLVSNAIKFTPESGRVDVRVRALEKRAVVEVRDSGIGIPANEQQHLFQRFYRTSTATERAIQGTGLGLAISKAIAEAHDGRITLTSEEDVGTTFRVELPLGRHAEVSERAEVAS